MALYGSEFEALPRETLIKLARVYSRNWQTLDGNWFGVVEAECGLETASRLDLVNWEKQSVLEAKRLIAALEIEPGSLDALLRVLSLMSWQLTSPLFVIESQTPTEVVFHWDRCAVQESRERAGKSVFQCGQMKLTLLRGIASVAAPRAVVTCLAAPPGPKPDGCWCRWRIGLADA
jgi:hypothetical protein